MTRFVSTEVPAGLLAQARLGRVDYADCYQAVLGTRVPLPEVDHLARLFFSAAMPGWVRALLAFRNRVVRRFGLRSDDWVDADPGVTEPLAVGEKVGPWAVVARSREEIVFSEDDRHLRFALSLRVVPGERAVQATTLVEFHNLAGRAYFVPVRPLHRLIVPRHMESVLRATGQGGSLDRRDTGG